VSAKRTAPLTPLERAFVEVMERRDRSRRYHVLKRRQSRKKTVDRSANGTARPEAE
jgi:hypothetical protein